MKSPTPSRKFGRSLYSVIESLLKAMSLLTLSFPIAAWPVETAKGESGSARADGVRIYSSVEERREAGYGRKLTEWLTVSGLLEVEIARKREKVRGGDPELRENVSTSNVQLGLEAEISESLKAEFLFEAEWGDGHRSVLDEAFLAFEVGDWELEAGRLYLPFGKYYSHFVTGPLLEFGETRGTALVSNHSLTEFLEVSLFAFDGEADNAKKSSGALNWGAGFDISSEDRVVRAGAAYLADLTDAADVSRFKFTSSGRNRVGSVAGYVLVGLGSFEVSAEYLGATREFQAFDQDVNQPTAMNLEIVYAPGSSLLYAVRLEHSDELPDEPENQVGVSATWRLNKYASVSVEYLFGRYKDGFVFDDGGNPLSTRRHFAIQIAAEF